MTITNLPTYKRIQVAQVFVPDYQRIPRPDKVKRILGQFNPVKVRPPLVNDRGNDRYAVVDGQHTLLVLKAKCYIEAPMAVIRVPVHEENDIFSSQHENNDAISPMERLWADYRGTNGHSIRAQHILEAIEAAGWIYTRDKRTPKAPKLIKHPTGVEEVYDRWVPLFRTGEAVVQDVLMTIDQVWPNHLDGGDPNVARAMGKLLYEYNLESEHVTTLSDFDLSRMLYRQRGKGAQATKRDTFAEEFRRYLASRHSGFTSRGVFRKKRSR